MTEPYQSQMPINPDQILDIIVRRKWLIIIPLCISLTIGLFFTLTTSKTYEASTLILVQPQRVPTNYVRSVVTSSINERISTISQQILSRSNLEKIIDQFGLFENATGMYLEDKVESMRRRVKVKIERARHGAEAFSIIFTGSDPQRVMQIANSLASYFMDENLKVREAQAVGTSEFLDSELEKTRKRLEEREQRLADYRRKYMGGLPDELETNLRSLDRLDKQLIAQNEMLRQAQNSLNTLETQIAQTKEMAAQSFGDDFSSFEIGEESLETSKNDERLTILENKYETLLLKYTEKHPDVKKVKKTIEKLQKTIEEEKQKANDAEPESLDHETDPDAGAETLEADALETVMPDFAGMQQELQKKQLQGEVKKISANISKLEQQMKVLQQRVDDTPKRELDLQSLQRDYSNIQGVFNSLLDRKLEAELSVNMEKKQKGEQFRILDHARLPEKPISPNVKMLFLLSIATGLGFGCGVIFLLEFFDHSIRTEDQIEKNLGLTILASIPPIADPKGKTKRLVTNALFVGLTVYAAIFLIFFAILNHKGLDRTISLIKINL